MIMGHQYIDNDALANTPTDGRVAHLADVVAGVRAFALAPRTLEVYRWQWQRFTAWCRNYDQPSLPTSPDVVVSWLASRWYDDAAAAGSLRLGKAAIKWAHIQAAQPDPTAAAVVRDFLRGIGRVQSQADADAGISRTALTADASLVRGMLDAIDGSDIPIEIRTRDAALITTAYTTAARRGELAALVVADAVPDGAEYRLNIRRGKADQLGEGRTAGVIDTRTIAAASRLRRWLAMRPYSVAQAPLFVQLHRSGSCPEIEDLSPKSIARRIALWGQRAGQPGLNGHSTRRGAASDAARAGAREVDLMRLGGWKSPTMPARYVASADALTHHPLRGV